MRTLDLHASWSTYRALNERVGRCSDEWMVRVNVEATVLNLMTSMEKLTVCQISLKSGLFMIAAPSGNASNLKTIINNNLTLPCSSSAEFISIRIADAFDG
jgi:hypothetical protein